MKMDDFWNNKNVLVTGAGGFKGSHVVESLINKGANVVSLMRDFDPNSYFEKKSLGSKCIVVIGDFKDFRKIIDILSKYEISCIFHIGAQAIVPTALVNPLETLESNIMGTVNVLEAARLNGNIKVIVVVSSDKAYGISENLPYKENERLQGSFPYDVSKSSMDLISQMYAKVYDMPVTIGRCANVFGPGDLNMNRIVPGTMEAVVKDRVLKIRSDGKMIREYIYVKDVADAYIKMAENIEKTKGHAFNVASKNVLDVIGIVEKISNIINKKIKVDILNQAKAEIPNQHLDGSKIKEYIGWEAESEFNTAILDTFNWYEEMLK